MDRLGLGGQSSSDRHASCTVSHRLECQSSMAQGFVQAALTCCKRCSDGLSDTNAELLIKLPQLHKMDGSSGGTILGAKHPFLPSCTFLAPINC